MNANELADELERFESFNGDVFFGTCAVMLRQQQSDIEALKEELAIEINEKCKLGHEIESLKTTLSDLIRPKGKSKFAGQTHLGVYLGEK
jgi:regulator of replication initiation timing